MTSLTASDFCPGHGGECDAYSPDFGCEHPNNFDHGVRSFCGGTCQTARDAFEAELNRVVLYLPGYDYDAIVLDVSGYGHTPESYRVTFTGRDAQAWALAYMTARPDYYFNEVPCAPVSRKFRDVLTRLYPTCEHGMSLDLCEGPGHYMSRDQEMARGW
jgi:hypothetical protein